MLRFEDDSDLTFNLPNSVPAGTYDVQVITPGGTSVTGAPDRLDVEPPGPTLGTVAPSSGTTAGGTSVNLTGTGFTTATDVFFGTVDVTSFTINSNTSITVSSPAHGAGQVSVTVENPGGTSGGQPYTFVAPPTLGTVAPSSGTTAGGTSVNLTGTNFNTATDVFFGATDVSSFTINSNTSITVSSPAHAAGQVSVTVENPGGTSGGQPYTFVTPPTLGTVAPSAGTTAGGTTVTLTGSNFDTATDVFFGAVDVTSFTINSNTSITVSSPAHAAGLVSVTVENPGATSGGQPYTFVTPPTLGTVAPSSGTTAGGTSVTLTGTSFNTATDVFFGTTDVTSFTINSNTSITVSSPAHAAGAGNVTVENPGGTSGSQPYTFVTPPTLTTVAPSAGTTAGGTTVTLTGTNFTTATDVFFGSTDVTSSNFTINNSTSITVSSPAHAAGLVSVTVKNPGATSGGQPYTFVTPPTLGTVAPSSGSTAGGTSVNLTGTGFNTATDVFFGATDVTSFTINSNTSITVSSPAHAAGAGNVTVENPGGTSASQPYTFVTPPTLGTVAPSAGTTAGGTTVTLTGTNFDTATDVFFGAVDVTSFTIDSNTSITVSSPAHAAGLVSVTVENPGATSGGQPYTFVTPPTLGTVAPSAGKAAGGTSVTLTGTSFTTATDVFFGADDVTSFTINSNTSITVSSPAHAAGGVSVTVENPGGTSGGQPYTFDPIPTLTGISPPNGSTVGGNTVTLTGTGFTGATDVNFGGTDIQNTGCGGGPCFSVTNDTTISVTNIPGGAAGAVDVDVVTPGGTSGTQQYTYMGASLSNVSPPSGSSLGGNSVTLTGPCLPARPT